MATMTEIEEARDFRGANLDCRRCERYALAVSGTCVPGHACVHDRYARRIDRFFSRHPELARDYLEHPYFEVRAVAAKYLDVFHLSRLAADADETVRQSVAQHLPAASARLRSMRSDPHREVRIRVAGRLPAEELLAMIGDPDYFVRQIVARRLPVKWLARMTRDTDVEVRRVVARRIGPAGLDAMSGDPDAGVRQEVLTRLAPDRLGRFVHDPDWCVRHAAAARLPLGLLGLFADDPEPEVRALINARLSGHAGTAAAGDGRDGTEVRHG